MVSPLLGKKFSTFPDNSMPAIVRSSFVYRIARAWRSHACKVGDIGGVLLHSRKRTAKGHETTNSIKNKARHLSPVIILFLVLCYSHSRSVRPSHWLLPPPWTRLDPYSRLCQMKLDQTQNHQMDIVGPVTSTSMFLVLCTWRPS